MRSLILLLLFLPSLLSAQSIDDFTGLAPRPQNEILELPASHAFQVLVREGDSISSGGTMTDDLDYTGFAPIAGASTLGYLAINSESAPGAVHIMDLNYNSTTQLWEVGATDPVDFSAFSSFGGAFPGTVANCGGAVTAWGTVMTCEENTIGPDANMDGWDDFGWVTEIDPVTREIVDQDQDGAPDKIWAMGRFKHENVAIASDLRTVYQGEDDAGYGFLFKYVADSATRLGSGTLYVLAADPAQGTGTWEPVPNTTQADQNNTLALADTAGGYPFNRIEDVEIGPDGRIYFASTGEDKVWRFTDQGSTISGLETFVEAGNYAVGNDSAFFNDPDNLAFDCAGNLWVLQDGAHHNIWVAGPQHQSSQPDLRLFAHFPIGSEPTGLTFTPDCKFGFLSVQHPADTNTIIQTDAAGQNYAMDRDAVVVFGRVEDLGLPLGQPAPLSGRVSVAPNPSPGQFRLAADLPGTGVVRGTVRDVRGAVVVAWKQAGTGGRLEKHITTEEWAPGTYWIALRQGDWRETISVVVD